MGSLQCYTQWWVQSFYSSLLIVRRCDAGEWDGITWRVKRMGFGGEQFWQKVLTENGEDGVNILQPRPSCKYLKLNFTSQKTHLGFIEKRRPLINCLLWASYETYKWPTHFEQNAELLCVKAGGTIWLTLWGKGTKSFSRKQDVKIWGPCN